MRARSLPPRHRWPRLFAQLFCLVLLLALSVVSASAADEKEKEEKKPLPPTVIVTLPLAVKIGATNKVTFRGQNLTNVTEVRFTNDTVKSEIILKAKTKADVPKDADAKKIGDTQLTAEIVLPADATASTHWFVVSSPDGISEPKPLRFLPGHQLSEEREPNNGFREAQALMVGRTISGTIKDAGDVDVFQFEAVAGQHVRIEIEAASASSALDSLITVYDGDGHVLASNDDARGAPDSFLEMKPATTGLHYLSVLDANDKGGPTHVYLLRLVAGEETRFK